MDTLSQNAGLYCRWSKYQAFFAGIGFLHVTRSRAVDQLSCADFVSSKSDSASPFLPSPVKSTSWISGIHCVHSFFSLSGLIIYGNGNDAPKVSIKTLQEAYFS